MPTISDSAICIRRWDFSETSQTVSLLTREYGVLRGLAKGSRRPGGLFSGGFDLLTRGDLVAIVKPHRELATLTEWNLRETFGAVRTRLDANRIGLFMADLVHHMFTVDDPHPAVFDALLTALHGLAVREESPAALLQFQWTLLDVAGYRPEVAADAETAGALDEEGETLAFSPRAGGIVADTGTADRWRVRRETVLLLRQLAGGHPVSGADATAVERANRLLACYVRELIGSEPRSMQWAFGRI